MLFKVSRYAEILNSIITSLFEVLGNTRIELNHPAFMQRPEDDITTAVAAKKEGIAAVENGCFMLINVCKTKCKIQLLIMGILLFAIHVKSDASSDSLL